MSSLLMAWLMPAYTTIHIRMIGNPVNHTHASALSSPPPSPPMTRNSRRPFLIIHIQPYLTLILLFKTYSCPRSSQVQVPRLNPHFNLVTSLAEASDPAPAPLLLLKTRYTEQEPNSLIRTRIKVLHRLTSQT